MIFLNSFDYYRGVFVLCSINLLVLQIITTQFVIKEKCIYESNWYCEKNR